MAEYVDPIWRDVMGLVCTEWNSYRIRRMKVRPNISFVKGNPNALILRDDWAWYVRASPDTRVYGRGIKRIATDVTGDSTYTRNSNTRAMKYCRVYKGVLGKIGRNG